MTHNRGKKGTQNEYVAHHANVYQKGNTIGVPFDNKRYSVGALYQCINDMHQLIMQQTDKEKIYLLEKLKQIITAQYSYEVEANLFGAKEYYKPNMSRRDKKRGKHENK